jgi:hypothetical protein
VERKTTIKKNVWKKERRYFLMEAQDIVDYIGINLEEWFESYPRIAKEAAAVYTAIGLRKSAKTFEPHTDMTSLLSLLENTTSPASRLSSAPTDITYIKDQMEAEPEAIKAVAEWYRNLDPKSSAYNSYNALLGFLLQDTEGKAITNVLRKFVNDLNTTDTQNVQASKDEDEAKLADQAARTALIDLGKMILQSAQEGMNPKVVDNIEVFLAQDNVDLLPQAFHGADADTQNIFRPLHAHLTDYNTIPKSDTQRLKVFAQQVKIDADRISKAYARLINDRKAAKSKQTKDKERFLELMSYVTKGAKFVLAHGAEGPSATYHTQAALHTSPLNVVESIISNKLFGSRHQRVAEAFEIILDSMADNVSRITDDEARMKIWADIYRNVTTIRKSIEQRIDSGQDVSDEYLTYLLGKQEKKWTNEIESTRRTGKYTSTYVGSVTPPPGTLPGAGGTGPTSATHAYKKHAKKARTGGTP